MAKKKIIIEVDTEENLGRIKSHVETFIKENFQHPKNVKVEIYEQDDSKN